MANMHCSELAYNRGVLEGMMNWRIEVTMISLLCSDIQAQ